MKKISKKLLSLLLAVVMVLSMSVSVFASADVPSVTVTAKRFGTQIFSKEVPIADIAVHEFDTTPCSTYDKQATVADALIKAYKLYKPTAKVVYDPDGTKKADITYNWDLKPYYGNPGIYFNYYAGLTTANESYTPITGGGTHYKGDTWTLYVNGVSSYSYASETELVDGMKILMDYDTVEFDY